MNRKSKTKLKAVFSRIFCFAVYLFLFLPISVVIANSFNATTSKPYLSWKGFTFNWYVKLFENNALLTSFGNTLIIAVVIILQSEPVREYFARRSERRASLKKS